MNPRRGTPRVPPALLLFFGVTALSFFLGCGSQVGGSAETRSVNELMGTYRGAGLDDSSTKIVAAFGKSPPLENDPVIPLSSEVGELALNNHPSCPVSGPELRYQQVSFGLEDDRVCDMLIVQDGAATTKGVAVGDALDDAHRAYPTFQCGDAYRSEDSTIPYCSGKVAESRYLWFGGDPINVIEMNTEPLNG
jgi:hypothetical protein